MSKSPEAEIIIRGKRIYLRKVTESDVDGPYYKWMNDPEILRYLEARFLKNTKDNMRKTVADWSSNPAILFLAIILDKDGRHIGNIKLGPINKRHQFAEMGIIVGEKDLWGKGYGTEAIELLSEYAFKQLKLHKLTAGCYANNGGSIKIFKKAGFRVEGIRKKHCLCEGEYVDTMLFGKVNQ